LLSLSGLVGLGVVGLGSTARPAPRRDPVTPAQLDNPCRDAGCKRRALDHFVSALTAARTGTPVRALRISYFGDSLTADDHITSSLRTRFGALVGAGGPGFVYAAPPHPYCQHKAVTRTLSGSWKVLGISTLVPPDRLLGLGGSAEAEGGAVVRFQPTSPIDAVDVHYLAQPHGGSFAVFADGAPMGAEVDTAGDVKRAGFARVDVPASTKQIELRTRGRVRLFGASLEAGRGVVVDNLGVVNATAKQLSQHDMPDHMRNQLAHRATDLVVVMLGTNEAEWLVPNGAGMVEHERVFNDLLATIRSANPDSSCLVVSPLDQLDWHLPNAPARASIPAMVEAQHRAAVAQGCAFWDTYTWMGGKGSSLGWYRSGLVVKDFQHPTSEGAARIGEALFGGLMATVSAPRS
jgi:lysophospholipase L1-like esterase